MLTSPFGSNEKIAYCSLKKICVPRTNRPQRYDEELDFETGIDHINGFDIDMDDINDMRYNQGLFNDCVWGMNINEDTDNINQE